MKASATPFLPVVHQRAICSMLASASKQNDLAGGTNVCFGPLGEGEDDEVLALHADREVMWHIRE